MAQAARATSCGLTSVTLQLSSADGARKHSHSTAADIMRAMEASMPVAGPMSNLPTGELGAAIQGRINEHEIAFDTKRQTVKADTRALVDRAAAARQHVLVLGAIQQLSTQQQHPQAHHANTANTTGNTRANTHLSSRAAAQDSSIGSACTTARRHGGGTAPATARGGRHLQPRHHEGRGACTPGRSAAGGSAWASFRGDSMRELPTSEELSGSALDGAPEAAAAHTHRTCDSAAVTARSSRTSRRQLNRQGSTGSLASRTSGGGGSVWGGSVVSRLSSSYGGGGGEASVVGGSSCSGRKSVKRKPPKPKPGRVAQAFAEFAGSDDWVSQTLLRHRLASIIQARWRGYAVRQRWRADREQLVEEERARLRAPEAQAERVQELRGKLAAFQQRKLLQAAAEAAAGADGGADGDGGADEDAGGGGEVCWDAAVASLQRRSQGESAGGGLSTWQSSRSHRSGEASQCRTPTSHPHTGGGGGLADAHGGSSDGAGSCSSDSGCWSDAELEDVAAIKFRAVTPPWECIEGAWGGGGCTRGVPLSQALRQRLLEAAGGDASSQAAGGLPWECGSAQENSAKLDEARRRRICRRPEPVRLPAPAVAAAAAAGLLAGSGDAGEQGAAAATTAAPAAADDDDGDDEARENAGEGSAGGSAPLPALVVDELLLPRYAAKYAGRLGLPQKMPGRRRFLQLQAAATARAEAASAACRDAAAAAGGEVDDGGGLGADTVGAAGAADGPSG